MKVVTDAEKKLRRKTAVALGTFDGMHAGHAAVIKAAVRAAEEEGLCPCVWTFSSIPAKQGAGAIDTTEKRRERIACLGIKLLVMPDFTDEMKNTEPEVFFSKYLIENCRAKHLVCGFNYTFGARASGDVGLLRDLCERAGIKLTVIDPVLYEGEAVSSTAIREALKKGDRELAEKMLDHEL